ncbi:MAG TPA: nucleotidyltransferase domain-containing protein [Aliidongia sp.]|uniref:nucleotidyltransferase family protein n=1 Tax=Aliidongia sp. TaxID=1914230 RepID=UPI002DDD9BF4|nr:nucleotidyltransferase domain-containing protein [Aliidongia sp.]HEV2677251.1 nucleotidyltransferase domain-containing protein [Aliidongia sp.]
MPTPLFSDIAALTIVCRRHHIRRLALFGSSLRGTDRPDSDVDLLVEDGERGNPGTSGGAPNVDGWRPAFGRVPDPHDDRAAMSGAQGGSDVRPA